MPHITDPSNHNEPVARLTEIVLDHLGIPRPGSGTFIKELQDVLLPAFMQTARSAWLLANPIPLRDDMINDRLRNDLMETTPSHINRLKQVLNELGVHDLLFDVANSADISELGHLPIDSYEQRLLKAIAHPNYMIAVGELLTKVAEEPKILANSEVLLTEAETLMSTTGVNISNLEGNISKEYSPPGAASFQPSFGSNPSTPTPKRRKVFSGLGKVLSGCVLLSGNAIMIPTVTMGNIMALPVLGSLAGGIAAVGEGVSQLVGEG